MAADGYQCVGCGIAGGELYPESPNETAVLGITRRLVDLANGQPEEQLITECKRCKAGGAMSSPIDVSRLLENIRNLDEIDQDRLRRWVERGRRGATPLDRIWNEVSTGCPPKPEKDYGGSS